MSTKPTNDEIHSALCAPGQYFEIETVPIRGVPTRTWKNAHRNLGAVLAQGAAAAGERDFIVLDDEHLSHACHFDLATRFAASLVRDSGADEGISPIWRRLRRFVRPGLCPEAHPGCRSMLENGGPSGYDRGDH